MATFSASPAIFSEKPKPIARAMIYVCQPTQKLRNKELNCRWFQTPWRSCDVSIMVNACKVVCSYKRYLHVCITASSTYRWSSARLHYLQCVRNGDTAVLHQALNECQKKHIFQNFRNDRPNALYDNLYDYSPWRWLDSVIFWCHW